MVEFYRQKSILMSMKTEISRMNITLLKIKRKSWIQRCKFVTMVIGNVGMYVRVSNLEGKGVTGNITLKIPRLLSN